MRNMDIWDKYDAWKTQEPDFPGQPCDTCDYYECICEEEECDHFSKKHGES